MVPAPNGNAVWLQDQVSSSPIVTRGSVCTEQVCSCTGPDRLSPGAPCTTVTSSGPSGAKGQTGFGGAQAVPDVTVGTDCTPELETARPTGFLTFLVTAASALLRPLVGGAANARIWPVPLAASCATKA